MKRLIALMLLSACQMPVAVTVDDSVNKTPETAKAAPEPTPTPEVPVVIVERPKGFFEDLYVGIAQLEQPGDFDGNNAADYFSRISNARVLPGEDGGWFLVVATDYGDKVALVPDPATWNTYEHGRIPTYSGWISDWYGTFRITSSRVQIRAVGDRYEVVVCWNDPSRIVVDGRSAPLDIVFYDRP